MATLDATQYEFIKKISEGIKARLIPDAILLKEIKILPITEKTTPDEISQLYTEVMDRMMILSNAILGLRSIEAGIKGQMNLASAQGTEVAMELFKIKANVDRLLQTIDNYVEAYNGHLDTLKTVARGLNSECYLYNQRFAAYNV